MPAARADADGAQHDPLAGGHDAVAAQGRAGTIHGRLAVPAKASDRFRDARRAIGRSGDVAGNHGTLLLDIRMVPAGSVAIRSSAPNSLPPTAWNRGLLGWQSIAVASITARQRPSQVVIGELGALDRPLAKRFLIR